jgi:hypothetical protein
MEWRVLRTTLTYKRCSSRHIVHVILALMSSDVIVAQAFRQRSVHYCSATMCLSNCFRSLFHQFHPSSWLRKTRFNNDVSSHFWARVCSNNGALVSIIALEWPWSWGLPVSYDIHSRQGHRHGRVHKVSFTYTREWRISKMQIHISPEMTVFWFEAL